MPLETHIYNELAINQQEAKSQMKSSTQVFLEKAK
jgi:hypothetical protein